MMKSRWPICQDSRVKYSQCILQETIEDKNGDGDWSKSSMTVPEE